MQLTRVKYKGEYYNVTKPRADGWTYTCEAWKDQTGRKVKSGELLRKLATAYYNRQKEGNA